MLINHAVFTRNAYSDQHLHGIYFTNVSAYVTESYSRGCLYTVKQTTVLRYGCRAYISEFLYNMLAFKV